MVQCRTLETILMAHLCVDIKITHVSHPDDGHDPLVVQESFIVLPQCPLTSWTVLMILMGALSDVEKLSEKDSG